MSDNLVKSNDEGKVVPSVSAKDKPSIQPESADVNIKIGSIDINDGNIAYIVNEVEQAQNSAQAARIRREIKAEDRLEWLKRMQQILVLVFMGVTLSIWTVLATWAAIELMFFNNGHLTDLSEKVLGMLLESGLAAIVAFFAIKRFEK
jgi:hypothetical protein